MKRGPDSIENLPDQAKPKRAAPITYDDFIHACETGNLEEVEEGIQSLSVEEINSSDGNEVSIFDDCESAKIYNFRAWFWGGIPAGNYALRKAAKNGHLAVVDRLLETEEVAPFDEELIPACVAAAIMGHVPVVRRLCEFDTVRAFCEKRGFISLGLRLAAGRGELEKVNEFLETEYIKNVENVAILCCALEDASENGHLSVANRLLEFREIKEEVRKYGDFLVYHSAKNGHLGVVRRLLEIDDIKEKVAVKYVNLVSCTWRRFVWSLGYKGYCNSEKIETVIESLAEEYPKVKSSLEKEKRKNEASAVLYAYKAARKKLQGPQCHVKQYGQKDTMRIIAKMVKNSPPPAEQPEGLSCKKSRAL